MAALVSSMSATIPDLSNHMTDAHGQPSSPGLAKPSHESGLVVQPTSKKPKLSLQTSSLGSTYGSLTRGLAANQQATHTPTTTNTLVNTWDLSYRPSPVPRTESPRPAQLSRIQTQTQQERQPYSLSLPFGVRSILKNSPLPPRASSVSASPRDSKRKVFFPQTKKVIFSKNLEDVIHTNQYIAKHSDLSSSEDDNPNSKEEPTTLDTESDIPESQCSPPPTRKRKDRRDSGIYIDTSKADTQHTPSQDSVNPRPLKNCKRRKWQWTVRSSEKSLAEDQSSADQARDNSPDTQNDESEDDGQTTTPTVDPPQVEEAATRLSEDSTPDQRAGGEIFSIDDK